MTKTKEPLYVCKRHNYESNPETDADAQLRAFNMHKGHTHQSSPKSKTKTGTITETISLAAVQRVQSNWIKRAAEEKPQIASVIIDFISDLNTLQK